MSNMVHSSSPRVAYIVFAIVISAAIAGYFTGLQSPMNRNVTAASHGLDGHSALSPAHAGPPTHADDGLSATLYADMNSAEMGVNQDWTTRLAMLSKKTYSEKDFLRQAFEKSGEFSVAADGIGLKPKLHALANREGRRAFNGAPPTVPHPIDQMSSQACAACHTDGWKSPTLRIPKMPHPFFANCTQCHVEQQPSHFVAHVFQENSFVGLPAPQAGPRAFAGAPPQIPHTTWMRNDCLSCHGPAGQSAIQSTHPWRSNCQQCHAPSAALEQSLLPTSPRFLSPPNIISKAE